MIPSFKPQTTGGSLFVGGSPKDALEDWTNVKLRRVCETSGEQGIAVLKLLSNRGNQHDPQKVAVVASFLQRVFNDESIRPEDTATLAAVLLRREQ